MSMVTAQPGCVRLPSPSTSQPKSVGPPARGPTSLPVDSPGIQPHRSPAGPKHAQPFRPSSSCGLSTCTPFPPDIFPCDCQAQAVSFLHLLWTCLLATFPQCRGASGEDGAAIITVEQTFIAPCQDSHKDFPPGTLRPCECPGEEKQGSWLAWPGPAQFTAQRQSRGPHRQPQSPRFPAHPHTAPRGSPRWAPCLGSGMQAARALPAEPAPGLC